MSKKAKCLLLFSGGLDSILAAKVLMEQKISVVGLTFKSCFFDEKQAKEIAKRIYLKLKIIDFSKEHLEIVRKPKYGHGKNMNPCIDCHLLMLKKAKLLMEKLKYDFIATGEVLGERPMSQNKNILKMLEKKSELGGHLLRPLSAKSLDPTVVEKEGTINRKNLFAFSGRQRKEQFRLVKKFKIKKYPTPSGGCCLTYKEFSKKLKELFKKWPKADCEDIELLKYGRHFWKGEFLIVVGRDRRDNQEIRKLKQKGDLIIEFKKIAGPTALIRSRKKISRLIIKKSEELLKKYSKKIKNKNIEFKIINCV